MAYKNSAGSIDDTGDGSCTATVPSGVTTGDLLYAAFGVDRFAATVTPPAGWTQIANADLSGPDGTTFRIFRRVADGTEGATQKWLSSSGARSVGVIMVNLGGRASVSPETFAQSTLNTSANSSPITMTAAGGTAASGDDLLVFYTTDNTAGSMVWSASTPTGLTSRQLGNVDDGTLMLALFTKDAQSAGATGNMVSTATLTSGTGQAGWASVVVAVKTPSAAFTSRLGLLGAG